MFVFFQSVRKKSKVRNCDTEYQLIRDTVMRASVVIHRPESILDRIWGFLSNGSCADFSLKEMLTVDYPDDVLKQAQA